MSIGLTLLDKALILAQHELEAMRTGDVETAELHLEQREILLDRAYATHDEQAPEDYRLKLIALQGYNQLIHEEGRELLESIRHQLLNSRDTARCARSYVRIRHLQ
jgi:hypothetical protein